MHRLNFTSIFTRARSPLEGGIGRGTSSIPAPAAGDWLGVVIFLVIAIVSILGKLQESKKKGDSEQPMDSPSIEPEDLPEPIRRMLYGDREQPIRTAKPARPIEAQQTETAPTVVPRVPQPAQQPRPRPVTVAPPQERLRQLQTARQVVVHKPPQPAAPRIPDDDETRPRMQPLIQKPKPRNIVKATVPPRPKPVVPKAIKTPEPEELIQAAFASDEVVKPIANPWMFKDKMDIRRAIVLAEILGPPLALRE